MASRLLGLLLISLCAICSPVLAAAPVSAVGHYGLDIRLDSSAGRFTGSVSIAFTRAAGDTTPLAVDMAAALKAENVVLDDQPATFTHEGDVLSVQWPTGGAGKNSHVLLVRYSGLPDRQGLRFTSDPGGHYVVNFGMPYTAKHWWPDFDDPSLKARSADIRISLPKDLTAVSNGSLAEVKDLPGGQHEYHWVESYPIYPDVLSIAAADYVRLDSSYTDAAGQAVPIRYYVLKQDAALAEKEFAFVPDVLKVYERFFGAYPFAREKYGIAEVPFPSFREHQTIPSLGRGLMTGASPVWDLGTVQNVIAHDMAHQWFGNSLTLTSWSDVWLNEGFATYAVALWHEQSGGATAYRDFMHFLDSHDFSGSLYIKDAGDMNDEFTSTTFNKGAWVLHMLRHVMGDPAFFAALHTYAVGNAYGEVDTARWMAACERQYGKPLDWFFEEWVYGMGQPTFKSSWSEKGGELELKISQTQSGQVFTLPLDVEVDTDGGSTRQTVWLRHREESLSLPVQGAVKAVVLDPDGWVLKD